MLPTGEMIRPTSEIIDRICNPENPINTLDDHITTLKMALIENFPNLHTQNRVYHYLYDCYWLIKHGVSDDMILKERLRYRKRECDSTGQGCRMWYRRQDEYSSLRAESVMFEFNTYFNTLLDKVQAIRNYDEISEEEWRSIKRKGALRERINLNGNILDVTKKINLIKSIRTIKKGVYNDLITSHTFMSGVTPEIFCQFLSSSYERGVRGKPAHFEYIFTFREQTRKWLQLARQRKIFDPGIIRNPDLFGFADRKQVYDDCDVNYGTPITGKFYKYYRMNITV